MDDFAASDFGAYTELAEESGPRRVPPRLHGAPKIRGMYWCDFWRDAWIPEMWKTRPIIVISYRNTLQGPCLVVPTSTDPQEGRSKEWAHELSLKPDGRQSWVICNHLYTVSPSRLSQFRGQIPRVPEDEFNVILSKVLNWLPRLPALPGLETQDGQG